MNKEEYSVFEERVREHERQVAEKGFAERAGERFYEIETLYGKIWYITRLNRQKRIFRNSVIIYLLRSSGVKVAEKAEEQFMDNPEDGWILDKYIVENSAPEEDLGIVDRMTEKAMQYFADNLHEAFYANLQRFVDEAFFFGVVKTVGKESPNPPQTEAEIYKSFTKFHNAPLKQRLDIGNGGGRKPNWSREELKQMVELYDSIRPIISEAKKTYNSLKGNSGWAKAIAALYPQLPQSVVERLNLQGVSPACLALSLVAERFETEPTDYLRKLIIKARALVNDDE